YVILCVLFHCYDHHPYLHSFPTRRSSDLPHTLTDGLDFSTLRPSNFAEYRGNGDTLLSTGGAPLLVLEERTDGPVLLFLFNPRRSEEHTSELQSRENLVCRLLLEKRNQIH